MNDNVSEIQLLRESVSFALYSIAGSILLCLFALLVGFQLGRYFLLSNSLKGLRTWFIGI